MPNPIRVYNPNSKKVVDVFDYWLSVSLRHVIIMVFNKSVWTQTMIFSNQVALDP